MSGQARPRRLLLRLVAQVLELGLMILGAWKLLELILA